MTDERAAPEPIETANERAYWAQGYDRGYAVGYRVANLDHESISLGWVAGFVVGFASAAVGFVVGSWIVPIILQGV